jgi:ATP-dependent helicase/nuclease subunit B
VRDGWETIHAEQPFASLLGAPWMLGGLEIRGVVDRVDARGEERRIIDYKTSDSPRPVVEAHLGRRLSAARLAEGWPPWQLRHDAKGDAFAWRDLQLPLYALAARQAWGRHPETGYFHLAKAVDECQYEPWTGLTPELLAEAEACALGVIAAIGRGEFWPPRQGGRHDDFGWLLADDAASVVDPSALIPS